MEADLWNRNNCVASDFLTNALFFQVETEDARFAFLFVIVSMSCRGLGRGAEQ